MMKARLLFINLFLLFFLYESKARMENYCANPPFLSTDTLKPNILFVIDVSGSMRWSAYNPNSSNEGWCGNNNGCGWNYNGDEEGYFTPDKIYRLIGNCDSSNYPDCYWQETDNTNYETCPNTWYQVYNNKKNYKGSCLNFLLMSRIDLLRWAITGGRPYGCSDVQSSNCDPSLKCSEQNCELEAFYGDRVIVPKSRIKGILQTLEKERVRPRFGAIFFSGTDILRKIKVYVGDYLYDGSYHNTDPNNPYTNLKRAINYISPSGRTPSGPAMWEAYDYFKQSDDHPINNDFKIATSSSKFRDPIYVCDEERKNCKKVPCSKNFVILASDGQWNTSMNGNSSCSISNGFEYNSSDPVVPAYRMHKDILRTINSISGKSFNVSVHGVYSLGLFLGGTGEQSLKNVAIYGSFDTSLYNWPNNTTGSNWNGGNAHYPWVSCNMDDCGSGKGSACTPLPPSSPDWDKDGDNIPDSFLNAKNALEIKNSLLKFIMDILRKTASGTSVSVLSEKATKGAIVHQAVFYPTKAFEKGNIDWIGYLYSYWFLNTKLAQNIREDTNQNKILDILDDNILFFDIDSTTGNLIINGFTSKSDGNPDKPVNPPIETLDDIKPIWEAGELLASRNPSTRTIIGVDEDGNIEEFIPSNADDFDSLLGTTDFPDCLKDDDGDPDYEKLISYIRGNEIQGCRSRTINDSGDVWKLGDIVYSTPKVVDYDNYAVVFAGTNDGMLHAFKVGKVEKNGLSITQTAKLTGTELGKELWAFIPQNVMPYLRYLANPDYCHLYLVDLSPYIVEIDENEDGNIDQKILIGGMRLGGGCGCISGNCINPPDDVCPKICSNTENSCSTDSDCPGSGTCIFDPDSDCVGRSSYFALDITNPNNPQFLWEFTDDKLGFSYSGPAIIKRRQGSDWKYFTMFASGPTDYKGYSEQPLNIFVLDLLSGNLEYTYEFTSLNNSFGGRLFTEGLDVNEDGETDFVFLGYTNKTGNATAHGGLIKIWTGSSNPAGWDFDSSYYNLANNPITAKVTPMKCFDKWFIYFGTGKYLYKTDDDQNINAIYGIPFTCDENNDCSTSSVNSAHSTDEEIACSDIGTFQSNKGGWMIQLKTNLSTNYLKERNISDPAVSSDMGIVFFTTTSPTADLCGFGGKTRAWALNCATGESISSQRCQGYSVSPRVIFKYLLQLSGGDIKQYNKTDFSQEGGRATQESQGLPSEEGGIPITPPSISEGKIILWIER